MASSRAEIVSAVVTQLARFPDVELCILYGSAIQDRLSPQSDIDLAVASADGLTMELCIDLSLGIGETLDREISLIDMDKMYGLILQEVLVKGHTILSKNSMTKAKFIL